MIEITVPKVDKILNYIQFQDLGIEPEYIEDHTYDPTYYNDDHRPVLQLHQKVYSKAAYNRLNQEREYALKRYEEWIKSAPYFITIKEK